MILGIDASNLRDGGGITHLQNFLRSAQPEGYGIEKVILWGGRRNLENFERQSWLEKIPQEDLDKGLVSRSWWQKFRLSKLAREKHCGLLYVPGGSFSGDFRPVVTMSRNMLPFETKELLRFGWSMMTLKMIMLRMTQARSFRRADGLIFLTKYARNAVMNAIGNTTARIVEIPHGVDQRFIKAPKSQLPISEYSIRKPYRVLYVSPINVYKHQWFVAEAIARLRAEGIPVTLELVGSNYPPAMRRLKRELHRLDPAGEFIRLTGHVDHQKLPHIYAGADLFVFASSCENMPNILLEAMAAGLPVISSDRGPMPEVLDGAGLTFDPECVVDIEKSLRKCMRSANLRTELAEKSSRRAQEFSWQRCAEDTLAFLAAAAESEPDTRR